MKDFNGKLAVVTGGASGVGFAIGEALAKEGAKVILTDVEKESLESSTALLANKSLDVCSKVADVSNIESFRVRIQRRTLAYQLFWTLGEQGFEANEPHVSGQCVLLDVEYF